MIYHATIRGKTYSAETMAELSDKHCELRDRPGWGARQMPETKILDGTGRHVATISYNGRIWTPEPYPRCTLLQEPRT